MDPAQIIRIRSKIVEELQQLEALRHSMETTLAGLVELEKQLRENVAPLAGVEMKGPVPDETTQSRPRRTARAGEPSASERVARALDYIDGVFTRAQLLAQAERFGKGNIGAGTFRDIFSGLLKSQTIRCVEGRPTDRDSLYKKVAKRKTDRVKPRSNNP
jgi:hypothetical protein